MNSEQFANSIAIVGIGLQFPGADSCEAYWQRLCAGQDLSRDLRDIWQFKPELNTPGETQPDRVNSYIGYRLDSYPENRPYGSLRNLPESLDPLFLLPLAAAEAALKGVSVPHERTGLIMAAIALPTLATSELTQKTWGALAAQQLCLQNEQLKKEAAEYSVPDLASLPHTWNKDAVGLCASLTAQAYDLGLGAFTIDAACASSLIAVHLACEELRAHRADAMVAGGLSQPDRLYTQMGFSALRALSRRGQCRPFDRECDGLLVGEGCGLAVLKRLPDAVRDGDTIYAVIRGIGISNDLAGSLVAPASEGQLRSMRQAYQKAGLNPQDMDWIECHGTGTPTGDRTELQSLIQLWKENGLPSPQRPCYLTSVKAMIGHLLTGAGMASLLRAALSLHNRCFTPQVNFSEPILDLSQTPFSVPRQAEDWPRRDDRTPRRAAVSAFGFGGINAHAIVEEWDPELSLPAAEQASGGSQPASAPRDEEAEPIAIVGMACHIGSADSLERFRQSVLSGATLIKNHSAAKRNGAAAEQDQPAAEEGPAENSAADLTQLYAMPGAYIEEVKIPVGRYKIPPTDIPHLLPQQLLMLQVADQALADAGIQTGAERPDAATIIGLGLDINASNYQLRWWITDLVKRWSKQLGLSEAESTDWLERVRSAIQSPLDAASTIGALGSIVASRIAREFRFGGPSYTVSSEENSGLDALQTACRYLQRREVNIALAGAVDLGGDLRCLMGSELPQSHPQPFDSGTQGTVPGEGAVALVVKRLSDAQRDGDKIYSIIRGWGQASAPAAPAAEAEGSEDGVHTYIQALRQAYAEAGADPRQVSYIEASGSGVPEHDRAEAQALLKFFGSGSQPCALGALSPVAGHLGACAGLASLAKAALCLDSEILPPLPGFQSPIGDPELGWEEARLHLPIQPAYWFRNRQDGPRLAGVSCRSRDGQCVHAVLQAPEASETPEPGTLGPDEAALLPIYGNTIQELCANLDSLTILASQCRETAGSAAALHELSAVWWQKMLPYRSKRLCLSIVLEISDRLSDKIALAYQHLRDHPDQPTELQGIYFTPAPLAGQGKTAFVYPGSGSHFIGMGRELCARFPNLMHRLDLENLRLSDQFMARYCQPYRHSWNSGWKRESTAILNSDTHKMMFSQVCFGTIATEAVRSLGIEAQAVIGYSLGESAALFANRAWPSRDGMLERMEKSNLFREKLSSPRYLAWRQAWNIPADEPIEWVAAMIPLPLAEVQKGLDHISGTRLLIVNTDDECVVGGYSERVEELARYLQVKPIIIRGVDAVHCDALAPVADEYRDMHTLPVVPQPNLTFYSGNWGKSYDISSASVAHSIVSHGVYGIDYPKTIRQAWEDGVRLFIEMGPGGSCTRMIRKILHDRPHYAHSVSMRGRGEIITLTHMLAGMQAYGLRPDPLPRPTERHINSGPSRPSIAVRTTAQAADQTATWPQPRSVAPAEKQSGETSASAGNPKPAASVRAEGQAQPFQASEKLSSRKAVQSPAPQKTQPASPKASPSRTENSAKAVPSQPASSSAAPFSSQTVPMPANQGLAQLIQASQANYRAYCTLMDSVSRQLQALACGQTEAALPHTSEPTAEHQASGMSYMMYGSRHSIAGGFVRGPKPNLHPETPVFLNREQCLQFAVGKIADVLGPRFAEIDTYPTRVRLPDEPLMLVDRILSIEGEPLSLKSGRLVTEHDVLPNAWYLDGGRAPVFLSVEAGQADLFLSGWLGIDFQTKGERVYRLLDATVCFHRGLPVPGETMRYDIKIDRFVHQGQTWLFFFKYDATINGELFLTMYNGCAGFFTHQEIRDNRGLVLTDAEKQPRQGRIGADYRTLVQLSAGSYSEEQIEALRQGDLAACFGPDFAGLPLRDPVHLPSGLLRLIHRIPLCDPQGGRWGLGMVQAEADVHPDDWYLTCHFIDDMVMPGTLMYECCAHALRVLLTSMGWVGENSEIAYEPVPGCNATLKCRGPVLQSTKKVTYQVEIKEIGYCDEPYVIADALMFADDKIIVGFQDISMKMTGQNKEKLERLWAERRQEPKLADTVSAEHRGDPIRPALFDSWHLLQFATGMPSQAFGTEFSRFDSEFIARLPGPPYQFLSRIVSVDHPFLQLAPGGWVEAQYDVPSDAWYFEANGQRCMPFCVLLEIPLQACGWLSAYAGSSRTSSHKLHYRNLGGTATLHREIFPDCGTITTRVRLTKCSQAGGLIIQSFDFWLGQHGQPIYEGTTTFGFFTPSALANQVGVHGAKALPYPDHADWSEVFPVTEPAVPRDCPPSEVRGLAMPSKALLMC
ncbi:type I polyketide synthase, partial [bacterium]|nr:type I polyketide synthase [bacterium]